MNPSLFPARRSLPCFHYRGCWLLFGLVVIAASSSLGQSIFTWTGGGANGDWNTAANWSGGSAPGSPQAILNFAGSTQTTATNNFSAYSAGYQIFFNSGASTFTLAGNAINFYNYGSGNPTIENDSTSTQTVNLQVDMEAAGYTFNINANNGNLNLGSGSGNAFSYYADNGASGLALNASNGRTITVYGAIGNGGGGGGGAPTVSISGSGTVIYAAANGYTGQTDINQGTLQINSGGGISSSSGIYLGNGGATSAVAQIALNSPGQTFSNSFTINPGSGAGTTGTNNTTRIVAGLNTSGTSAYSGAITVDSDFQVYAAPGGTVAITGQLTGGATGYGLVKTGSGTVLLENTNNNYTGTNTSSLSAVGTQIYGGTLGLYGTGSLGLAPTGAYNNIAFYGNGSLQDASSNIAFGSNRNLYIAAGVTGTLDNGGNAFAIGGVINGAGTLAATGSGSLTLTGTNTYSGGTTVNAGIVKFGNANALGSGNVTLGNATLQAGLSATLSGGNGLVIGSGSAATLDTQGYTVTLDGSVSGAGSLTKIGTGTLLLTTAGSLNASGGGIILNAGTLGVALGNNLGALPGTLTTDLTFSGNSTLQFESSGGAGAVYPTRQFVINSAVTGTIDTQNYSNTDQGVIAGAGSLAISGSAGGTLTLTSSNTYTGSTTIDPGATLQLGTGTSGSDGTISTTSGIVNNGTLNYDPYGSVSTGAVISGTGVVIKSGPGTQSYGAVNTYTGQTDINQGTLQVNSGAAISSSSAILLGNAGTTAATAEIALNSAGQTFSNNFTINAGAGAGASGTNNTTRIIAGLNTSGTSTYSGAITIGSDFQVYAAAGGAVAITGQLTGGATGYGLVKTGSGTVLLENTNNTYTGANPSALSVVGTQIYAGTLGIFSATSLGNSPSGAYKNISFYGNGALQDTSGSIAFGANRNLYIAGGVTGTLDNGGNSFSFAGVVNGSGALATTGTGTVTLTGINTYSGGTTVNAGTLNFGNAQALGGGSVTVGNATLQAGLAGTLADNLLIGTGSSATLDTQGYTVTLSGSTGGSGSLTKMGSGALILTTQSGLAASGGGINLNAGTLGISLGNNLGALPGSLTTDLTFAGNSTLQFETAGGSGAIAATREFMIDPGVTATIDTRSYNNTDAGVIAGPGALLKIGSGTLTLSGANTYQGGTTVNAGTLQLASSGALGSSAAPLAISNATLDLNGMNAAAGSLTLQGAALIGFNLGGSANTLAATSASVTGTNFIAINSATITGAGTYNLLTSSGGGLNGTFDFAGAQDLTVPASSLIVNTGSNFYRITLNDTNNAEQLVVSNNVPSQQMTIMPFGSSITAGYSAQDPYDGGGYRTQLYQNLVNDGRFNPTFVGSATGTGNLYAVNPASVNILTTANELANEGHPGWTTSQMLANMDGYDGNSGASGGYWLAPGNGVNPNYITVNIGGNDAADNLVSGGDQRLDAIVSTINALRPGAASPTTILSTICYRGDYNSSAGETNGALLDSSYNPGVANIVFNHVLAGQNVGYLDLRNIMDYSVDNDLAYGDLVHFTQAGYDKMANAWYQSIVYGAAYWTGNQGTVWNTVVSGSETSWALSGALTTDRGKSLNDPSTTTYDIYPDVFFSSATTPLATTLGADTTIRSLNFTAGATGSVAIGGSNTLTIGSIDTSPDPTNPDTIQNSGGITVQAGSGAHTLAANVVLGADQTWGNVSSNAFTVSGVVSGSNNLAIAGSYTVYNAGSITSGAAGTSSEVVATTSSTYVGSGSIVLAGNDTYTGSTTINQYGTLQLGGTNVGGTAAGAIDSTSGVLNNGTLIFNRSNAYTFNPLISGSGSVTIKGNGTITFAGANTYTGSTTVNAGTLVVAGSIAGSTVNISAGATLGSGAAGTTSSIAPSNATASAVEIAGALSPGMAGEIASINFTLQAGAKLNFQSGSSLLLNVGANNASGVVAFSAPGDWLAGSGNATLALNGIVSYTSTYTIFSNATTPGFTFANITGYDTADYQAAVAQVGSNYELTFQSVPEPRSYILFGTAFCMVFVIARRRDRCGKPAITPR